MKLELKETSASQEIAGLTDGATVSGRPTGSAAGERLEGSRGRLPGDCRAASVAAVGSVVLRSGAVAFAMVSGTGPLTFGTASRSYDQRSMPHTQPAPPLRLEGVSETRLFLGDAIIAIRVLNEALQRAVTRVFGVPRDSSSLVTLFVIGAFARALHRVAAAPRTQARKVRSSPTVVGDTMIGAAALKETLDSVAGHPSRDTSSAAALIVFAVLAHSFRPAVEGSLRAVGESVRGVMSEARKVRAAIRRYGD
jgi:hypothetical protein